MVALIQNRESGKSVRDKINEIIAGFNAGPYPFETRADLVLFAGAATPALGAVANAGGISYRYTGIGSAIADLPGWVPYGTVTGAHFGFTGSGTAADTAKLNTAIAYVSTNGGGDVRLGAGTILVANTNAGAASWDNERCIYIGADNVRLVGAGIGSTILKRANGERGHVIKMGSRVTSIVSVKNCAVLDMTIDGDRLNVLAPTAADYHWGNIDVSSGCSRIHLSRLHLTNGQYYGIGFQRENIDDCHVSEVLIEDCGADGIDCKDDDGLSRGNTITNVTVRRFGLAGVLTQQAGINTRSGWKVSNFTVEEFDGDKHGIRDEQDGTAAAEPTTWVGGTIKASARGTTKGAYFNIAVEGQGYAQASDITVSGCNTGFEYRSVLGQYHALRALDCGTGHLVNGLRSQIADIQARGCDLGLSVLSNECTVTGAFLRSNTKSFDLTGSYNRLSGGLLSGNTNPPTDTGTDNAVEKLIGLSTNTHKTGSFPIDSTGMKSIVVAHGLAFTPALKDIQCQLYRVTAVNDYVAGAPNITSVDGTNVAIQLNVTTASATAGATVGVSVKSVVKKANGQ